MRRHYSIDFIKFFAVFAVVIIHASPFKQTDIFGLDGSEIVFISDTLSRFAVPFFFVVSGFFFASKLNENPEWYVKKNVFKLIKMYTSWVAFYFAYDIVIRYIQSYVRHQNVEIQLNRYFDGYWSYVAFFYIGNTTSGGHLWYLTALIWSILTVYLFFKFDKVKLLLVASLLFNAIGILSASVPEHDALFFGLFYTCLGFFIFENQDRLVEIVKPKLYGALIIFFSLLQIFEKKYLFSGQYFFSTIPSVFLLFLMALKYSDFGKNTIISKIGSQSVGIYLIHVFFLNAFSVIIVFFNMQYITSNILWNIFFTPFIFLISYFSYCVLQNLKKKENILKKCGVEKFLQGTKIR